ncbi:hypothetical protein Nepgr_027790 [Nepenthes gracilis]|uniref:Methyltransferase n=1 Tax=Nepenthes gracilis TaxID=150966 RepID=A0AAD3Y1J6_NEPGR|nr:hypothetical protein Nepgr_027790 [Nepenthes gracilis]
MAGGMLIAPDLGNGVASFGGYLLSQNILTLFVELRDSHKAPLLFALERGIPASVAMSGTRRMPFIALLFDLMHCSRCLLSFKAYNATYIIEVDHLLCPGGHIMILGSLVHWVKPNKEWNDSQAITKVLCFGLCISLAKPAVVLSEADDLEVRCYYIDNLLNAYAISSAQVCLNTPADFDFKLDNLAQCFCSLFDFAAYLATSVDIIFPIMHGCCGEFFTIPCFMVKGRQSIETNLLMWFPKNKLDINTSKVVIKPARARSSIGVTICIQSCRWFHNGNTS